jgi:hypothetical protein
MITRVMNAAIECAVSAETRDACRCVLVLTTHSQRSRVAF